MIPSPRDYHFHFAFLSSFLFKAYVFKIISRVIITMVIFIEEVLTMYEGPH